MIPSRSGESVTGQICDTFGLRSSEICDQIQPAQNIDRSTPEGRPKRPHKNARSVRSEHEIKGLGVPVNRCFKTSQQALKLGQFFQLLDA